MKDFIYLYDKIFKMKTLRKSKGERKNWTPLKDVKPVKITAENTQGRIVVVKNTDRSKFLID